uniref:Uncharacterized protein n=1 Tax=Arundo donax TaxID=35708 RepID=A0A0A9ASN3_ARUDO
MLIAVLAHNDVSGGTHNMELQLWSPDNIGPVAHCHGGQFVCPFFIVPHLVLQFCLELTLPARRWRVKWRR